MVDLNMDMALKWANEIEICPKLPSSLHDISVRRELILELDKPFLAQTLRDDYYSRLNIESKNQCLKKISQISNRFIFDVENGKTRASICLRLWSGCLHGAKTIAFDTMDGPVTPEYRSLVHKKIIDLAKSDPIFLAGAEVAVDFKKSRNEGYSFEGLPEDSFLIR
jgi:hypothetical protein